jgi:hypothetical protein
MSEYQYYEFLAIDRPLSRKEMGELRSLSTRAEITPTSFVNTYEYGNFKGDPRKLMWRYFDAFVYYANWGTRQLMLRLPRGLLDEKAAAAYRVRHSVAVEAKGEHVLVEFESQDDSGDWDWEEADEDWMSRLTPLRSELMAGDLRALYLGWLAAARQGDVDEEAIEPPVPPGLGELTPAQKKLVDFLRVDEDLLELAAESSGPAGAVPGGPSREDLVAWVTGLAGAEKDGLLLRVAEGEEVAARMELLRRFRADYRPPRDAHSGPAAGGRTVDQLLEEADARAETRERREAARKAAERQRKEREQAEKRAKYLEELAGRQDAAWQDVESMIDKKQPAEYDKAVGLLKDLRDLSVQPAELERFEARVRQIRQRHATKSSLMNKMSNAGLVRRARSAT